MSKILIIEDEVAIADLERDYLELSGFTVEIENTGDVGLARALAEDFDLFILDLMLPGVDGFEICKRIREQKNTPILMVSAKKEDIDKIRGLGLGADDYITQPFSPSELVARVKALLRRADAQTSELRRGELLLNLSSHELWKNDRQITLTPMEYKLLSLMMKNPGRIFTKAQLYENINGEFFESDENTIMVHISKLRDKIETDPKQPVYIKTVRGVGYRFEV